MSLSVREALRIDSMQKAVLIAGAKGLDHIIEYIDISETPDSCLWVRANEFLITTGYSIKDNLAAQLKLLRSLSQAQEKARQLNVSHAYGNVEALLAHPDLHVVHNCTPNNLHAEINR